MLARLSPSFARPHARPQRLAGLLLLLATLLPAIAAGAAGAGGFGVSLMATNI